MVSKAVSVALVPEDWDEVIAALVYKVERLQAIESPETRNYAVRLAATRRLIEAQVLPVLASRKAPDGD